MKGIIAFICFVSVLALTTATPLCEKAGDCKDDECCVALSLSTARTRGVCVKLRRERQPCSPPESQLGDFYGGKYLMYCPCQQSLKCVTRGPTRKEPMFMDVKKVYRCQKEDATTTGPDQTTVPDEVTTVPDEVTTPPGTDNPETPAPPETTAPPDLTTTEEEAPAQGPGGDKPRDDDCEDWELPC